MFSPEVAAEILARLERIEAALAALAMAPRSEVKPAGAGAKRLTTAQACLMLSWERKTLERAASRGLCSQIRPKGHGRGKPVYYWPDEIAALVVSEAQAADLMARKRLNRRPG